MGAGPSGVSNSVTRRISPICARPDPHARRLRTRRQDGRNGHVRVTSVSR